MKMKIARYSLGLVAVLLAFGCQLNSYGTLDTAGLEGYWQFDGNRYDSSINNRYVALEGGPAFATGLFGDAIQFDGDSGKSAFDPKGNTVFDLGADDFTVQVWVSFDDLTNEQVLIEKWTQDPAVHGWTLTKLSGGSVRFAYVTAAGDTTEETGVDTPVLSLAADTWHHVIVRRSATSLDIFVDGISVQSATINATVDPSTNPLRMALRVGGGFPLTGRMDEVAFWSRALSDTEITGLYNGGAGTQVADL